MVETVVGPLREIPVGPWRAPYYVIPFDEDGICTGPRTAEHLLARVADPEVTHVIVVSHGWNTTWPGALDLYDRFLTGFLSSCATHAPDPGFRPVLVGLFWPSIVLTGPSERAPAIAGLAAPAADDWQDQVRTVAEALDVEGRERFYDLAQRTSLAGADLEELAALLRPVWAGVSFAAGPVDELAPHPDLGADELVEIWRRFRPAAADEPARGPAGVPAPGPFAGPGAPAGAPAAAGLLDVLDPRNIVRVTTVLIMKDRAGRIGARGVARLLGDILAAGSARVHLAGHSYGGKVVLSAVCAATAARQVDSVLLLQPAMSRLCFAADVAGLHHPGGYRPALDRVRQPIRTTFSSKDVPLGWLFQWAARRSSDLGEVVIAGEPSRYAALGGYGPPVVAPESTVVPALAPGTRYAAPAGDRVLGIESTQVIAGHGDISVPATWWMLADQVTTG